MDKECAMHTFDRGAESGAAFSIYDPSILLDELAFKVGHVLLDPRWDEAEAVSREAVSREAVSRLCTVLRDDVPPLLQHLRMMQAGWSLEVSRHGLSLQEASERFSVAMHALCEVVSHLDRAVDLKGDDFHKALVAAQMTFHPIRWVLHQAVRFVAERRLQVVCDGCQAQRSAPLPEKPLPEKQ